MLGLAIKLVWIMANQAWPLFFVERMIQQVIVLNTDPFKALSSGIKSNIYDLDNKTI
jgi:hypothetical protein